MTQRKREIISKNMFKIVTSDRKAPDGYTWKESDRNPKDAIRLCNKMSGIVVASMYHNGQWWLDPCTGNQGSTYISAQGREKTLSDAIKTALAMMTVYLEQQNQ